MAFDNANFPAFVEKVEKRLLSNVAGAPQLLFTTDVRKTIFDTYLGGWKDAAERQYHNCSCCRTFMGRYGMLVTVDEHGLQRPAMWDLDDVPEEYKASVSRVIHALNTAKITGVFVTDQVKLGESNTNGWNHFAVKSPVRYVTRAGKSAGQIKSVKGEEFTMLRKACELFSVAEARKAVAILSTANLYRAERTLPSAEWFVPVLTAYKDAAASKARNNLLWRAVATAPEGFARLKNNMLGTVLAGIKKGDSESKIRAEYEAKMRQYQQQTAPVSAGNLQAAERLVEDMGIAASLPRRYATRAEVVPLWQPPAEKRATARAAAPAGVFGHLSPNAKAASDEAPDVSAATTMTWAKFMRTVLPKAHTLEALVPNSQSHFMALVTAENADSPPILQWDEADNRNQFSWYYAGGSIDGSIRDRVVAAGGKYDDVDVRASLIWNNRNDLDLCFKIGAGQIYFGNMTVGYGSLDVDRNRMGETDTPVENIRWPAGKAPNGDYEIVIWNYHCHAGVARTPYRIEVEIFGKTWLLEGVSTGRTSAEKIKIGSFKIRGGSLVEEPKFTAAVTSVGGTVGGKREIWGVQANTFVPVAVITKSPNEWKQHWHEHRHTMFLLDGCVDPNEGKGQGLFVESLISDLRPARRALDAYTKDAVISGTPEACGLGYSDTAQWDLTLRVTGPNGRALYRIDRAD